MINLLPKGDQEKIRKEYLRRFFIVSGVFFAFIVAFATILLAPSYIFLSFESRSVRDSLELAEKGSEKERIKELELSLSQRDKKLDILKISMQNRQEPSQMLKKILDKKPEALKLDTLLYEKETKETPTRVFLQGLAASRNDLLAFVRALENDSSFSRVVSPISNLLLGEDLIFSLSLEIPKKQ